jgi:hypothetical protein
MKDFGNEAFWRNIHQELSRRKSIPKPAYSRAGNSQTHLPQNQGFFIQKYNFLQINIR